MIAMNNRRIKPSPKKALLHSDNDQDLLTIHPTNYHSTIVIDKFLLGKKRELESVNQTIYFRDLVFRVTEGYGEANWHECSYKYHQPTEIRLIHHIQSIFKFAQEDHRANNCEQLSNSTFITKEDKKNHITRLTTHEFSLYTKVPLTLIEYGKLIEDIQKMAETLEPNIHILLSSFAVLYQNNPEKILNVSVYVQGGSQPILHCFSKNSCSNQDINYNDMYQPFSQNNKLSAEFISMYSENNEILIYTGSVFEITTYGGAKYIQAFDICNDITFGHSQQQLERLLLNNKTINQFIPDQIEHCLSSFSITIQNDKLISDKVLHVDPHKKTKKKCNQLPNKSFDQEFISNKIANSEYSTLVWDTTIGYFVVDPPFGRHYSIEVLEERCSAKSANKYRQAITAYNKQYMNKRAIVALQVSTTRNDKALIKHSGFSSAENMLFFTRRVLENHSTKRIDADLNLKPRCTLF
jgi:hypothetical protein